jgi:general stress protein 26
VWGVWVDDALYFSTDPRSRKARNIAANPEVVVHLESGADVLILEGTAEQVTDPGRLAPVAEAYEAKYDWELAVEDPSFGIYSVRPRVAFSWTEDLAESATRWRFAEDPGRPAA